MSESNYAMSGATSVNKKNIKSINGPTTVSSLSESVMMSSILVVKRNKLKIALNKRVDDNNIVANHKLQPAFAQKRL